MPKRVSITVDSTCDMDTALLERFHLILVPLTITLGDTTFPDTGSYTPDMLYARYRKDGTLPKTTAVGVSEFIDIFRPLVEDGGEVVHLSISAELSGTANNARLAAEEFPAGRIFPVDTRMLSAGIALLAIEAAECRDRGMGAAEIAAHLESLRDKVDTSFVLDTLEFMAKGGRCSNFAAIGANLLKLKPALEMKDGKLVMYKKYRGNMEHVYRQYLTERLEGKKIRTGHVVFADSGGIDNALLDDLARLVAERTGAEEVLRMKAGCTICTHCGPKTMGVLFLNE